MSQDIGVDINEFDTEFVILPGFPKPIVGGPAVERFREANDDHTPEYVRMSTETKIELLRRRAEYAAEIPLFPPAQAVIEPTTIFGWPILLDDSLLGNLILLGRYKKGGIV